MTYTEPSNEYVVENALPMKDEEGMNTNNYFEFSVTTKVPTNDTDDNGVSIPYEISITESEDNTLTNDKIKMYVTEVEGEKELDHTLPTLVSYFEPSLYKDGQIKVGFNLHLHRNGNETITTKYRLRAWIDNNVDVSDWDTAGEFIYKFRVNVNGEATYQGYYTDESCFSYELNDNNNYSIIGYDFSNCSNKNIVIPTYSNDTKVVNYKEILAVNWMENDEFLEFYKDMMISDGYCDSYGSVDTYEDWQGCLLVNSTTEEEFNKSAFDEYNYMKLEYSFLNEWIGDNYYEHEQEIIDTGTDIFISMDLIKIETAEDEERTIKIKIEEIKSFSDKRVVAVNSEANNNQINNLNSIVGYEDKKVELMANSKKNVNGIIIPKNTKIANSAFSTLEVNSLYDNSGNFPSTCFEYQENNNISITSYFCTGVTNLRIPSQIEGIIVNAIAARTFQYKELESVVIPNTITTIGNSAFFHNNLISIDIPEKIELLDEYVFAYNKLTKVIIPNGVKTIKREAFSNNQIENIIISNSVTYLSGFNGNKLTKIEIPANVTTIGNSAFSNNQLSDIDISENIVTIESNAFSYNKLKNILIPNSVTTIGKSAFRNNKLTNVVIPTSISKIEDSLFEGNLLSSVSIPENITEIGNYAFRKNQLKEIEISNSVSMIRSEAFNYNKLKSVKVPVNIKELSNLVFANNELEEINLPEGLTKITDAALENNKLKTIIIPSTVTHLGTIAFRGNPLTKIINGTGLAYKWSAIISNSSGESFVTGKYGDIEIVAE